MENRRMICIARACPAREFSMRWLANQSQGNCHVRSGREDSWWHKTVGRGIAYDMNEGLEAVELIHTCKYFLMRAIPRDGLLL